MGEECRENCGDHTGQEERIKAVGGKLTLVLWLLAILITVMLSGIGVLYGSIQGMDKSIASVSGRFSAIEAKLTILEATDTRTQDRLDRLERKDR
jgi:hypothetical protein